MTYHEEEKKEMTLKLRKLLQELPPFCYEYFRGIEPTTAERTRLGYAHDLKIFFQFLLESQDDLKDKSMRDITIAHLAALSSTDLEMFLDYISYYDRNGEEFQNGEKGKARKLAAIRSMFKYFYRKEQLASNPASLLSTPKIHDKTIVKLDVDEIARLLDQVESGDALTKKQQVYHKANKTRDLALITLLLGTGIRVSECVGLDMQDVDFEHNGVKVVRKGGNEAVVYFGNEVREALMAYYEERKKILTADGHENALFLSMQKRRLTVRSVENLVGKYSQSVISLKHISPHKLRSSYGTALYNETGDIYLVADVLGHKDVNTTRKHYAQLEDARRREAAKYVHLRKDD